MSLVVFFYIFLAFKFSSWHRLILSIGCSNVYFNYDMIVAPSLDYYCAKLNCKAAVFTRPTIIICHLVAKIMEKSVFLHKKYSIGLLVRHRPS